eukprot:5616620-Ditylum_brightwellii.AAC.1
MQQAYRLMARNDRAAVAATERIAAAQACCEANGIVQIKRIRMMATLSLVAIYPIQSRIVEGLLLSQGS